MTWSGISGGRERASMEERVKDEGRGMKEEGGMDLEG
jgi:hypothetical protein